VERCTFRICWTIAFSAASGSHDAKAATIAFVIGKRLVEHTGRLGSNPPVFHAGQVERICLSSLKQPDLLEIGQAN